MRLVWGCSEAGVWNAKQLTAPDGMDYAMKSKLCIKFKSKCKVSKKFCRKPLPALPPDSRGISFHFLWLLEAKFEYITSAFWIPHALSQSSGFNSRNFRHCGIHSVINFTYKTFIEVFMIWFVLNQPILPPPPPLLCLKQNKWPSIIWHSSDINHNPHWITFKSTRKSIDLNEHYPFPFSTSLCPKQTDRQAKIF